MTANEQRAAGLLPPAPSSAGSTAVAAIVRVQLFLAAIRSVYLAESCLTEVGADYLGVTFRFPTLAEQERLEPPADVRPLHLVKEID